MKMNKAQNIKFLYRKIEKELWAFERGAMRSLGEFLTQSPSRAILFFACFKTPLPPIFYSKWFRLFQSGLDASVSDMRNRVRFS